MARGERRSLVSLLPGPLPDLLARRWDEECGQAGPALERLTGRKSPPPWFSLPGSFRESDLERLQELTAELVANCDVVLALGSEEVETTASAVIDALVPPLPHEPVPLEFVASRWTGAERLSRLLEWLGERRVGLVLLGGGPARPDQRRVLQALWDHVLRRHGEREARRRVVVATSSPHGPFPALAQAEGLRMLAPSVVPSPDYAALTPAGLFPAALQGIDPVRVVEGARSQARSMEGQESGDSPALRYALLRLLQAEAGLERELLAARDPALMGLVRQAERLLRFPVEGQRRAPVARVVAPQDAVPGPGETLTILTAETSAPPTEETTGLPAPVLEAFGPEDGEPMATEIRIGRLDGFHVGALLFFLQCVRGLTAVLHAPEEDKLKTSIPALGAAAPEEVQAG